MSDVAPDLTVVTQPYGCTTFEKEWVVDTCASRRFHAGIDLSAAACCGRPLFATRSGVVRAIGAANFAGGDGLGDRAVCIEADDGRFLVYGHCETAHVAAGDRVTSGQHIADVGTRGNSTGCHLHFEVRTRLSAFPPPDTVDPGPYLDFGGFLMALTDAEQRLLFDRIENLALELGVVNRGPTPGGVANVLLTRSLELDARLTSLEAAVRAIADHLNVRLPRATNEP